MRVSGYRKIPVCSSLLLAGSFFLAATAAAQTVTGGDVTLQMDGTGSITGVTVAARQLPTGPDAGGVFIRELTGADSSQNILFEDSFENTDHGWDYHVYTLTQEIEFLTTDTMAYTGNQSLLVQVLEADSVQKGRIISPADDLIPVTPGKRYRVQCLYKALRGYLAANPGSLKMQRGFYDRNEGFFQNGIGIYWVNANGIPVVDHQIVASFMDQAVEWKPSGGVVVAPDDAVYARVSISARLDPEYELESFVVDRVQFFEDPSSLQRVGGVLYPSGTDELSFIGFFGPLDVRITWTGLSDSVDCSGTVRALDGQPHAFDLHVALPLDAEGWTWPDDAEESRTIQAAEADWYANEVSADSQSNLPISLYPYGGPLDGETGLAACIPYEPINLASIGCDTVRDCFELRFRLGIDPSSGHDTAAFSCRFYSFEPAYSFRGVIAGYKQIWSGFSNWFSSHFDPSLYKRWFSGDFFGRSGANTCLYCDDHEVLSAQYTVPDFMVKEIGLIGIDPPPTIDEVFDAIEERKTSSDPVESYYYTHVSQEVMGSPNGDMVLKSCAEDEDEGIYYEAIFKISPDDTAGSDGYINYMADQLLGPAFETTMNPDPSWYIDPSVLDGVLLDNFLNQISVDCDSEHMALSDHGLTYTPINYTPGISPAAAARDQTAWLRGWLDANVDPPKRLIIVNWWGMGINTAVMPWCDAFSDEVNNAVSAGQYGPARTGNFEPAILRFKRTLAADKFRMQEFNGTEIDRDDVLDTLHTYLLYAMGGAPDMEIEFEDPDVFGIDNCLVLADKYNSFNTKLHNAGWEPLTHASCGHGSIFMERYGSAADGMFYLVVLNDGVEPVTANIVLEEELGLSARPLIYEVLGDERYTATGSGPMKWSFDFTDLRQRRALLFVIIPRER